MTRGKGNVSCLLLDLDCLMIRMLRKSYIGQG